MTAEPAPAAPALVLFDLDGTLADTFPDLQWALARSLEEHGLPPADPDAVRARVSGGARAMVAAALAGHGADAQAERVRERFLALYRANVAVRTALFEGMAEVLASLQARGSGVGVVTNKLAFLTDPLIDALGLRPRLRCVVSGDTAARAKPHPDPLLHAATVAGVGAGACAYVGDAREDVAAARAAGMPVAIATWGYLAPGDEPRTWGADALLDRPDEVLGWIAGLSR